LQIASCIGFQQAVLSPSVFGYSTRIEKTSVRPLRVSTRPESALVPAMKPVLARTSPGRRRFSSVPVSPATASEST
jgi:hypothetical protein